MIGTAVENSHILALHLDLLDVLQVKFSVLPEESTSNGGQRNFTGKN